MPVCKLRLQASQHSLCSLADCMIGDRFNECWLQPQRLIKRSHHTTPQISERAEHLFHLFVYADMQYSGR